MAGKIICAVKYAVDLVLLVEEEAVLQVMSESLTEIRRCCGVDMNLGGRDVIMRIKKKIPQHKLCWIK